MNMRKQLTIGVLLALTASAAVGEEVWHASWIGAAETSGSQAGPSTKGPDIVIQKALYGVVGDPAKQVDLTKRFQQQIAAGNFTLESSNDIAGKDPAYGTPKRLMLEYTLNGKRMTTSVEEDAAINLVTGETTAGKKGQARASGTANLWTCFRKSVTLEAAPRRAVARIAVDSKYWLWINGELVVFEGQLKRGPTPNDTYYDRVDLTGHLRNGRTRSRSLFGTTARTASATRAAVGRDWSSMRT